MAMNVSSGGSDEPMCDVNTTPLIDVMLVLLVMLILTLPVQNHGIKLEMPPPQPNTADQIEPERINIEIDPDGTVVGVFAGPREPAVADRRSQGVSGTKSRLATAGGT
jgi:biopolymer transport protein ExbD